MNLITSDIKKTTGKSEKFYIGDKHLSLQRLVVTDMHRCATYFYGFQTVDWNSIIHSFVVVATLRSVLTHLPEVGQKEVSLNVVYSYCRRASDHPRALYNSIQRQDIGALRLVIKFSIGVAMPS